MSSMLVSADTRLKDYLDERAAQDPVFAIKYQTSGKTIEGCLKYITDEARKAASGKNSFCATDESVFGLAVHYFDEDSIKEQKPTAKDKASAKVVATTSVADELSSIGAHGEAPKAKPQKPAKTAKPKTEKPKPVATKPVKKALPEEENIFDSLFD